MKVIYFGSYEPDYSRNRIIIKGLKRNGIHVVECRAKGIVFKRYPKLFLNFLKQFRGSSAIIVGFSGHTDVPMAFLLSKIFRKKLFFDIFTSQYETYVQDRKEVEAQSISAKIFFLIDWFGIHLADYVICDTRAHSKYYKKMFGLQKKRSLILYLGSDYDIFTPSRYREVTDVLFYGYFQPQHGVLTIIKAAAKLPYLKFKMIGHGQDRKPAEQLAKRLKLKNIQFVDKMEITKLAKELNRSKIILGIFGLTEKADCIVNNKVYDGLAVKKPVITALTKGTAELLSNETNCILIEPNNPAHLVKSIKLLIKNNKLRTKIAENGYKLYMDKLKPEIVTKQLIKYL